MGKHPISTVFLGLSLKSPVFTGFLRVFRALTLLFGASAPEWQNRSERSEGRYFSPKSTFLFGVRAAAMGVLSASTTGAAILK